MWRREMCNERLCEGEHVKWLRETLSQQICDCFFFPDITDNCVGRTDYILKIRAYETEYFQWIFTSIFWLQIYGSKDDKRIKDKITSRHHKIRMKKNNEKDEIKKKQTEKKRKWKWMVQCRNGEMKIAFFLWLCEQRKCVSCVHCELEYFYTECFTLLITCKRKKKDNFFFAPLHGVIFLPISFFSAQILLTFSFRLTDLFVSLDCFVILLLLKFPLSSRAMF